MRARVYVGVTTRMLFHCTGPTSKGRIPSTTRSTGRHWMTTRGLYIIELRALHALLLITVRYKNAWKHVYNIFQQQNATQVTFVFCPNVVDPTATPISSLYPGDAYLVCVMLVSSAAVGGMCVCACVFAVTTF